MHLFNKRNAQRNPLSCWIISASDKQGDKGKQIKPKYNEGQKKKSEKEIYIEEKNQREKPEKKPGKINRLWKNEKKETKKDKKI